MREKQLHFINKRFRTLCGIAAESYIPYVSCPYVVYSVIDMRKLIFRGKLARQAVRNKRDDMANNLGIPCCKRERNYKHFIARINISKCSAAKLHKKIRDSASYLAFKNTLSDEKTNMRRIYYFFFI